MARAHTKTAVAVVGCGYWGKNLVRNFAELGALAAVCDADPATAAKFAAQFAVPAGTFDEVLADARIDAVAIASPAALHAKHVAAALKAGKHVFVEKPLALSMHDGEALRRAAHDARRVLIVGHLLQNHPACCALLDLVRAGRLGRIRHVVSNRLSFGKLRTEEDVIWSFAPHDISMVLALIGEEPADVSVETSAIVTPPLADIAELHLRFSSGATARISVSWLNPFKEHRLWVAGDVAHAVFDDTRPWAEKLVLYDHRVDRSSGRPTAVAAAAAPVPLEPGEPLREECAHFLDCIARGAEPRTGAGEALRVLSVLARASEAQNKSES
jgi:UDP-2-acetamido-3-amino-2,3-dideoxy-glucuronate N-acetyltransferase